MLGTCIKCQGRFHSLQDGWCAKCLKTPGARQQLSVRTTKLTRTEGDIVIPEWFRLPGDSANSVPRGMAQNTAGRPEIFVTCRNEAKRERKIKNSFGAAWCADPAFLRLAVTAMQQLCAAAAASADDRLKVRWFGKELPELPFLEIDGNRTMEWRLVKENCKKLSDYLAQTLQTIRFECGIGDGIAAIDPTKCNDKSTAVTVLLNLGFPWRRFSDGEAICSIIHEFTHSVLRTKDEKVNGADQYGMTTCLLLAQQNPKQAWRNADNWAYYICEFKNQLALTAPVIDWNYMDEATFAQRGPMPKGAKTPQLG